MNDTIALLKSHRSIRTFADQPVPDRHVREAIAAGQTASTSSAVQAYSVIRVRNDETRAALADLAGPQPKVARCGAFLVFCGDVRRHRLAAQRDGNAYDARLEAFLVAAIDTALFAEKAVIAFESMGYGVCYIGGLRNNLAEVAKLLHLPEGVYPFFGLCVGVPAEDPVARPRLPVDAVLMEERYAPDAGVLDAMSAYDDGYERYMVERGSPAARWSESMGRKYRTPARADIASFYTGQGARLD
jgi:nitroreductase